jgi:hypothetical protein
MKPMVDTGAPRAESAGMSWQTPRRFRIQIPVNEGRLNQVLGELTGLTLSPSDRRKVFWFRLRCVLRSLGFAAGLLTGAIAAIAVVGLSILFLVRVPVDPMVVNAIAGVAGSAIGAGFVMWAYLYVLVAAGYPRMSFARAGWETIRHIPATQSDWKPSTGLTFADASGGAARALFRAVTGKRINVAVRPEVADRATAISEQILLVAPSGGSTFWTQHTRAAQSYATLLHDLNGVITIGRLDLVQTLIEQSKLNETGIIIAAGSAETQRYLHPLGRRTVLDAVAQYLIPAAAFAVSVAAVVISLMRSG